MAKKSDFTDQEWEALQKGVVGAGLLVSLSDRGFFDTFKEAGALAKHVATGKQSENELIRDLADVRGTGFGLTSSPDKVEQETLGALQTAKAALEAKAPDDLQPYRDLVTQVAESVAKAAPGGDAAESGAIEKVRSAVQ